MRIRHREEAKQDQLEVIHHEIPENAAAAGAPAIEAPAYGTTGISWRRMLRGVAITEAVLMSVLLVAGLSYGMSLFIPGAVGGLLFAVAAWRLPTMSRKSAIGALVVASLVLLMFGGMFFGWTGFMFFNSWFEVGFALFSTVLPIAAIVAGIATLRHRDGADAARTPAIVTAAITGAIALTSIGVSIADSDPTRLPGDVTLSALDFEFDQEELSADAGDVAIYLENKDGVAHNVEIKGEGKSDIAAGRSSVRHVFEGLSAGTYDYFCEIHPDMKGELTVS